jgi:hypothetical protein
LEPTQVEPLPRLHSNVQLLAFPENIRLNVTNTLAHYSKELIMTIKSFTTLAQCQYKKISLILEAIIFGK